MGNAQSMIRTSGALDSFLAELGSDIIYEGSLGSARFLKTVKCRHKNGYLVVKIFIKPDPGLSLRKYHKRLRAECDSLSDIPNVYTYQSFVETDKAGYLIRQWVASSLYDRISTRPFLSPIEKKWLAFQLLIALRDARNRKVAHGDLKTSNILITSWNWLLLSDFAPHKPALLPLDDPADFSFFFDTSGRRTCYIAPERFYSAEENPEASKRREREREKEGEAKRDGKVTEAMDCFSAGCVLAELFLEGAPLFSLSQLFEYRAGRLDVDARLSAIDDDGVRSMIRQMISVDPAARPTFDTLLHTTRGSVFPETFHSFLHNYVASVNELSSGSPFSFHNSSHTTSVAATPTTITSTAAKLGASPLTPAAPYSTNMDVFNEPLPSDSDHRMERIWSDYESVEPYLLTPTEAESLEQTVKESAKVEYFVRNAGSGKPFEDIFPVELDIPNRDSSLLKGYGTIRHSALEDGPALILLALVTANVRTCRLPSSKLKALDVFLALSPQLTDEAKLDRMVPYIVELLQDDAPSVRSAAVRTLMQVLMLVTVITPSNASIFPEYIIPALTHLVRDPEVSVRCMYAQCVVTLADTAQRYLEMGQALRAHGAYKMGGGVGLGITMQDGQEYDEAHFEVSYEASMQELQSSIQEHLSALLVDPSPVVKRAILHNISALCIFLGRQRTNDVLLSHMITYLNDRDWMLRYAFFDCVVDVAACAGGRSLEDFILPLMIQALSDVEETVVAKVLASLTSLCELGLFQKMRIWELMSATLGFLYHPNMWIRQGAAAFIASATKHLPPSDVWCILYPSLRHFLRSDVRDAEERSLLTALKSPLSRQLFDTATQWAMKADRTHFWRTHRSIKPESPKDSLVSVRSSGAVSSRAKSDEDDAQLTNLQQMGMTPSDESKLSSMKDFVLKLAQNISSYKSRVSVEPEADSLRTTSTIELQKLGVVPQTVFLKAASDNAPRSFRLSTARSDVSRTPVLGTPRSNRTVSIDHASGASGAPFEDLRRRLAMINGSATSLSVSPTTRDARSPTLTIPEVQPLTLAPSISGAVSDVPQPLDRPSSPSDSVTSSFRGGIHKLQMGSIEVQKVAPAVGSSKANATGLLDAHTKIREASPERTGRSSPISLTGTIRGIERPRQPAVVPISSYDGQDPGISNLLEHMYLDNTREVQNDFGPRVHEGPVRRRSAARHSYMNRDGTNRRLETTLVAHFGSHTDAVTGIAVSPDHVFFVTSSDDGTVKVWDTARLERNVTSKPRHTYGQHHAKVKAVCTVEGTHCFASAADDGSIHVVRAHVTGGQGTGGGLPKYGKLQVIRESRLERPGEYVTCMMSYMTATTSNLLYATAHSTIAILELRTNRTIQTMENPRHHGPITCLCLDRKRAWVVCGTSTGVLSLWDLRFGVLIRSWRAGVSIGYRHVRVHQCLVHPTKGKGRWIMVALETDPTSHELSPEGSTAFIPLVEVWDIETMTLVETFGTRTASNPVYPIDEPKEMRAAEPETNPAAAIAALVRARQDEADMNPEVLTTRRRSSLQNMPPPGGFSTIPPPDIRAFVVGTEFGGHGTLHRSAMADGDAPGRVVSGGRGFMLCGSEDHRIRLWDLAKAERSNVLSGPEGDNEKPAYSTLRTNNGVASTHVETWASVPLATQNNRPPQRLALINHNQHQLLKAHQDTVTALACVDSPFRGGIISGDRAGIVKVWKVEGLD